MGGLRWLDVKHSVGRGDAAKFGAQAARYCTDWGPGAMLFTLGYTEAFADELRAAAPQLWVLDPPSASRLLSGADADAAT